MGTYLFPEAGRLLQCPATTLRSWVSWGLPASAVGARERPMLSFHDLISLLVVRELRRRGLRLQAIHTAHRYMVNELGLRQPFAQRRFWTAGRDIFVKLLLKGGEAPVAASKYGQISFAAVLEESLEGVEYGADLMASIWRPVPEVWVNPGVRRGSPCVNGTRVDTWVLSDLCLAGEPIEYLARLYELSAEQVTAALEWEERLVSKAA